MTRGEGDPADGQAAGDVPEADETREDDATGSERPDAHLRDLADGCGCAEVWEYLSEARKGDVEDASSSDT